MNPEDLISIGKIAAPHGTQGEMIFQHVMDTRKPLSPGQALMLEMKKDSYVPYFVASAKARTEREYLLRLEEVNSRETAARLTGRTVWMASKDLSRYASAQAPLTLVGYCVYDDGNLVGPVTSVIEQPHQLLLAVNYKGVEALIPVHAETLRQINHPQKSIFTSLPDGLLDLYS